MNTEKYKSIIVSKELHELVSALADDNDRSISKTLERLVEKSLSAEADEVSIDSQLISGGTPRMKRLWKDLFWYQENSDVGISKKYVIDDIEREAIKVVLSAIEDTIN